MAEAIQELMYEVLRNLHQRFDKVDHSLSELRQDLISLRGQIHSLRGDINGLRINGVRTDDRLDRIQTRLDLREHAGAGIK
jgi:predicted  nucleic acid-binding Zn-ribbon protein